jgi:zinc transport system substrate-binding protein
MPARLLLLVALILALLPLAACDGPKARPAGPLRVAVTIAPLAGLVQPFLPKDADLTILMTPGRSEHGYEFSAQDLATLGRADVVVLVGLSLEPKIEQFLREHPSPNRQVVHFAKSVGLESPKDDDHAHTDAAHSHDDHAHHAHDEHGNCIHTEGDPHLWLDPILVSQLVPAIRSAVQTAQKSLGTDDAVRLAAVEAEVLKQVLAVDDEYRKALEPLAGKGIVTHHAAWGRLAERYGLKVAEVLRPVESVEPDAAHTARVIEAVRASGSGTIFVEPAYDRRSAERIAAAAGARVVTVDPLGTGDWFGMMRSNLVSFVDAFTGPGSDSTGTSR